MPQLEIAPVQKVSEVPEVMVDCAGVGIFCGVLLSSSITQSALPAVSALVASNRNLLVPDTGGVTVNVTPLEVTAPGVETVTEAVPAFAIFAAGTIAVNEVALIYVVESGVPFQLTEEVLVKFVPVAVSVKAVPPAVAVFGDIDVSDGLSITVFTRNAREDEVPAPVVVTAILSVPAVAIFAAGTIAVKELPLTKVVLSAVPFQLMVELPVKLVPLAVRVKDGSPAFAVLGDIDVSVGIPVFT